MIHDKTVMTSNIVLLMRAMGSLASRAQGGREEGMGILFGKPGEGKTTAIAHMVTQLSGIYIRANVTLTVTTLLQLLCRELMITPKRSRGQMLDDVVRALVMDPRSITIDEADYICRPNRESREMLDLLRDLYDLARTPVLLVGLPDDELVRLLRPSQDGPLARFSRRITERVEFRGLRLTDAQMVAGQLCEVGIEGALPAGSKLGDVVATGTLVEQLHAEAGGNVGRLVTSLSEVERWAKTNSLTSVTRDAWASR